jgi:uncharacterized protein YunC (DUF1805 family)
MHREPIDLVDGSAEGYVVELGPVNLVFARTSRGLVGCGAFDVNALNRFSYPAVKVGAQDGGAIKTVDDLLNGIVRDVNVAAVELGIQTGINGRDALETMGG